MVTRLSLIFTWQLTITGQLTFVPKRAPHKVSKSGSNGAAELQTGMRLWVRPGNFSLRPSITSWRLITSSTLTSDSFLLTSVTLTMPPASSALFFKTFTNSSSSAFTDAPIFCQEIEKNIKFCICSFYSFRVFEKKKTKYW